jgi:hypothetical protein
MQHIVLDTTFEFSPKPFPAFRGNLVFGRNKFDRIFVGTKVEPVQYWRVRPDTYDDVTPLLVTADRAAAETAKAAYDVEGHTRPDLCGTSFVPCRARIEEDGPPRLMRDTFRVIKTREKGTILIVPGEDTTPRALACIGAASRGFRGGVSVIECTATKLAECSAGNACSSHHAIMAIFQPGDSVAFRVTGRRENDVTEYTWDGAAMQRARYTWAEWLSRGQLSVTPEESEIL